MIVENEATTQAERLAEARRALLEKRLRGAARADPPAPGIRRRPGDGPVVLSSAQQRLWFFHQLAPACPVYNLPFTLRLTGRLHAPALRAALDAIVARHEILRTRIVAEAGEPRQVIGPPAPVPLIELDLRGEPPDQRTTRLQSALADESRRPFDLSADLMLRGLLVRRTDDEHVLLLVLHHIASDGWSLGLLSQELSLLYAAALAGAAAALPALPMQFADFAAWEREWLTGAACRRQLAYWKTRLAGAPAALELPADRPRPSTQTFNGQWELRPLPAALLDTLAALSRRESATLFMTLLTTFKILLHRCSEQTDLVVGTPVAGRTQLQTEDLIGCFVNTLPLRTDLAGDPTFVELLRRVRNATLEDLANQELPFDCLVEELRLPRNPRHPPLVQAVFVMQNTPARGVRLPDLTVTELESRTGTAKFDLTLSIEETPGGWMAALEYNTDLFAPATAARLLGHFRTLLEAVAADPRRRISDLPLLTAAEQGRILDEWSGPPRTDYPRDATLGQLFEAQAARTPDAVAVTHAGGQLTYGQLNARANQIARYVRRLGAHPGSLVGVCLERSADLIAALLGIVKAGCAYVSLDPAYPRERLGFMLQDTQAPVLLTAEPLRPLVNGCIGPLPSGADRRSPFVVCLDTSDGHLARESTADLPPAVTAEALAYVSYTSGSTGRPKGVCIPHRGVVRLVQGADYAQFGPEETFLQLAPVAFDASTFEIWGALLHGGRLVVCPAGLPTLAELGRFIQENRITTLWLTAGLFHEMVDHQLDCLRGVRQLLTGGDVLSVAHVTRALERLDGTRLINGYGPTENTTFTCCHRISGPPPAGGSVPIGRPIAHTQVFILDAARQPVPAGVPGELYTGGDGLAQGYLNQPELTREKFVPHPFSARPGDRLYRTGDRARWQPDGTIEFLGRTDRQVKLRGFRIELEEIETVLARHPAVRQAAVVALPSAGGEKRLIAYAACPPPAPPTEELRRHLQHRLPDYMLPAAWVLLDALPLNANGKVDRAALPAPDPAAAGPHAGFRAPRDPTEAQLAAIWERVLGVRPVGIHDNFFALGGHSLAGVRLFAQIEAEFGRKMPLASLFQAPTVEQLARQLRDNPPAAGCSSLVILQPQGTRPPVFFVHGAGGGNLWTYTNLVPHLGPDQPVYALESRAMRGEAEFTRIEDMAAHYVQELRTVQPHGPYYLSGYCFGGNVAYEMARQLRAQGEPIALLALLDSAPTGAGCRRIPWWRPTFLFRFAVNTACWLQDFLGQPPADRRRFIARKSRVLGRRLAQRFRRHPVRPEEDALDLEAVIDVALFPEIVIQLWKTHLRALLAHQTGPYPGRLTLFRTRGQPFLCSFDREFGWGGLAAGGVEVVNVPGAHEQIFMEPHVRTLSAQLRHCLHQAQARARRADHTSPSS